MINEVSDWDHKLLQKNSLFSCLLLKRERERERERERKGNKKKERKKKERKEREKERKKEKEREKEEEREKERILFFTDVNSFSVHESQDDFLAQQERKTSQREKERDFFLPLVKNLEYVASMQMLLRSFIFGHFSPTKFYKMFVHYIFA